MAKKIKGMYTFLEVVKGNLEKDSDPKLAPEVISEILEILLGKRQFELYEKVIGYYYGRELNEEEGIKILELVTGYNYKPHLARRMMTLFPNNKEWLCYFIENSLRNHQQPEAFEEALWLAAKPNAPEKIQRLALHFLIGRGRISEAKVFKIKLDEQFTKEETVVMYRYIMKNDMVYELKELFDLPGVVSFGMLKSFVGKYSVNWSENLDLKDR